MHRAITGYHRDEQEHWVAELACGHGQHVRHRPPWELRPWVTTPAGRAQHLGTTLDCVRCDRRELPEAFEPYKRTAAFDERSIPAGLRASHRLKAGTWGAIHVQEGALRYRIYPLESAGDDRRDAEPTAADAAAAGDADRDPTGAGDPREPARSQPSAIEELTLEAPTVAHIAPRVPHDVTPLGAVRFFVEFYRRTS